MKHRTLSFKANQGAALVVALIMLTLITIMVSSAFTVSTVSAKSVGNMQFRSEAIAAGNKAMEQVIDSPFTDDPTGEAIDIDIDNNGSADYLVTFQAPTCVSATPIASPAVPGSSLALGSAFAVIASTYYQTIWDLDATVTPYGGDGTSVHLRQGIRKLLSQTEYEAVCT
jgi:hypothetical protein